MIFKSRQVNLDPEPFLRDDGWRAAASEPNLPGRGYGYDPRPEFEPTRDPEPWLIVLGPWRNARVDRQVPESEWSPRREQFDTPVNPILVALRVNSRECQSLPEAIEMFLEDSHYQEPDTVWHEATPEQTIHARKVLTRLAALS